MKFIILKRHMDLSYEERYFIKQKSFDCQPSINVDINLSIAYLNLGVDSEDMCIKCLWGFSPRESWNEIELEIPFAEEGEVRLVGTYEGGLAWRLDNNKMWETYYDKLSGWCCIGNPSKAVDDNAVKIIKNMIIVLDSSDLLKAVWVQPIFM